MSWLQENLNIDGNVLDATLFTIAGTPITVATLIIFVLIIAVTLLVSALVQRAMTKALGIRGVRDEGTIEVARRLLHYTILATGLAIGLQTIGINLAALFAAGAVFAIGLGFAMQNIMQNFVSGIILLVERTIKPGDVLEVDGRFVKVQRMGIRATIARTLDEEEIIVPNSSIVQSTVKNYTLQDSIYRLRTTVGVIYGSDMDIVRRTLEKTANDFSWRHPHKDPVILLAEFGASSVDFEVSVWIEDPWRMRQRKSDLNEAIWRALKQAHVTIAFPQLDVHFDPPIQDALVRGLPPR